MRWLMQIFELTAVEYYIIWIDLHSFWKYVLQSASPRYSYLWLFIAYHSAMNRNGLKTEQLGSYLDIYWEKCDSFWLKSLALASCERYCVFSVQCWTLSSLLSTVPQTPYHFMAPSSGTGHRNIAPFRRHLKAKIVIAPVITGLTCFLESRGVSPAAVVKLRLGLRCLCISPGVSPGCCALF